jgi:hypothetical protein
MDTTSQRIAAAFTAEQERQATAVALKPTPGPRPQQA